MQRVSRAGVACYSTFRVLPQRTVSCCQRAYLRRLQRNMSSAHATVTGINIDAAKYALERADAVCFDVDSTVVTVEGIDELAAFCGKKDAVAALTAQAMGGQISFPVALNNRLSIIQPTRRQLVSFIEEHTFEFTPGFTDVVRALHARGTAIYLVSGGFTQMIFPLADRLGIPHTNVFANTLLFNEDGTFKDFDRSALTSQDGGKASVVQHLMDKRGHSCVVMVGDGVTDMHARPPASTFIGYGGIARRAAVEAGADLYVTSWDVLLPHIAAKKV